MPALTDGRFPSSRNGSEREWLVPRNQFDAARYEGTDDDERRLFYVAMTRAADRLIVGRPSERSKEWTSHFLYEAGLLPWPKPAPARPKQTSLAALATTSPIPGSKPPKRGARPRNARVPRKA